MDKITNKVNKRSKVLLIFFEFLSCEQLRKKPSRNITQNYLRNNRKYSGGALHKKEVDKAQSE